MQKQIDKIMYLDFKRVYIELKILLEKSKSWLNADIEKIEQSNIKLDESFLKK